MTETEKNCEVLIDNLRLESRTGKSREEIKQQIKKALVSLNLAYVMADLVDSLMLDCESLMRQLSVEYEDPGKTYFKEMKKLAGATRKWAQRGTRDINRDLDGDDYAKDVDWWYNMVRLIADRTGEDELKTKQVLDWICTMPSVMNVFNVKKRDFKHLIE